MTRGLRNHGQDMASWGGTDYGVRHTSWCKGTAIVFLESHNSLGLLLGNLTKENREWFGFKKAQTGVIVVNVMPGSIAANAGIQTEDLIAEWNGEKIENKILLKQMIERTAGREVKLSLLRAGEIKMVTLSAPAAGQRLVVSSEPPPPVKQKSSANEKTESSPYKLSANTPEVHNEIGDLYLRKGMYNEAIEEYKKGH